MEKYLLNIFLGVMAGALVACEPARPFPDSSPANAPPAQKQSEGALVQTGQRFNLRVLTEAETTRGTLDFKKPIPLPDDPETYELKTHIEDNRIAFDYPIDVSEEKFLVWSENAFDSPIVHATVSHRIYTGTNQWVGNLPPQTVWHEKDLKAWHIPLSDLLKAATHPIHPAETQLLLLELTLSNGNLIPMEIRFRVKGHLPQKDSGENK